MNKEQTFTAAFYAFPELLPLALSGEIFSLTKEQLIASVGTVSLKSTLVSHDSVILKLETCRNFCTSSMNFGLCLAKCIVGRFDPQITRTLFDIGFPDCNYIADSSDAWKTCKVERNTPSAILEGMVLIIKIFLSRKYLYKTV